MVRLPRDVFVQEIFVCPQAEDYLREANAILQTSVAEFCETSWRSGRRAARGEEPTMQSLTLETVLSPRICARKEDAFASFALY